MAPLPLLYYNYAMKILTVRLPDALVAEIRRLLDVHRPNAENVKDPARSPKSSKKRS